MKTMQETDQPYDDRESIEVNMPADTLFQLMLLAHLRDITLNQLVENILREQMEKDRILDENSSSE